MYRRFTVFALIALLVGGFSSTLTLGARAAAPAAPRLQLARTVSGTPGAITGPAARAITGGVLTLNEEALEAQKAQAAAVAEQNGAYATPLAPAPDAVTPNPVIKLKKSGLFNPGNAPSDSTGAIGNQSYIETVNSTAAIYRTTDLGTIAGPTDLDAWWDLVGSNSFDPQIMWDNTSQRFYYTGDAVFSDEENYLAFGFSKNANPTTLTASHWCQYVIPYGAEFPDYPKLGDSQHFALIGVNTFTAAGSFRGSDLIAVGKPGPTAITTCPDPATFKFGVSQTLKVGTAFHFTPTPAISIDNHANGFAVTTPDAVFGGAASQLGVFRVSRNATTGQPVFAAGALVTVPAFSIPAPAPQKGTTIRLDTSDTRITQAVAAIDPLRSSKFALWTQHTVKASSGRSAVRWYEIDPIARTVLQTGLVSHSSLWYFNGAISPDRKVKTGTTSLYGGNMLLNFSSSSSTTYSAIRMVSKRGADTTSAPVLVQASTGPNIDFACQPRSSGFTVCRWGDYAAATPDPNAPAGQKSGIVWSTNMWNVAGSSTQSNAVWRTMNWKSQP